MLRLMNLPRTLNAAAPGNHHVTRIFSASQSLVKSATGRAMGTRSNEPRTEERVVYLNKRGEEILFAGQYPPPGYIFVPAGNPFVTRHCRIRAKAANEDVYAYYLPSSRKKPARHKGLYVSKGVLKEVESDYRQRKAVEKEKWLQKLDKAYPNMPLADRTRIWRLCSSQFLKPEVADRDIAILRYVQDRYTALKALFHHRLSAEAAAKAREEADKILSVWRSKD